MTIKFIGVVDATNPKKYDVLANLVQERRSEIDRTGKVHLTDLREAFKVNVELKYVGHGWSIATMKIMQ